MKMIVPIGSDWLEPCVPKSEAVTDYDQRHFLTYARLLETESKAQDWREAAAEILKLDVAHDPEAAERCFRSHLDRAHWIVGPGLIGIVSAMRWPRHRRRSSGALRRNAPTGLTKSRKRL